MLGAQFKDGSDSCQHSGRVGNRVIGSSEEKTTQSTASVKMLFKSQENYLRSITIHHN